MRLEEMEQIAVKFDKIGLNVQLHGIMFQCPVCKNKISNDAAAMEPLCTGPHPSLDEHEPTIMKRMLR